MPRKPKVVQDEVQAEEKPQRLTPQQVAALPKVEQSVQAQSIPPGKHRCMLTSGCTGVVKVYSSNTRTIAENEKRFRQRSQYLRCVKCGRTPVNPRVSLTELPNETSNAGFDRHKYKKGGD